MTPLTFQYNFLKAENCALWLLYKLGSLSIPRLLTLAFLVDRSHLFLFYRLVFAGKYGYTRYGPVPYELWGKLQYHALYYTSNENFSVRNNIVASIGSPDDKHISDSNYHIMLDVVNEYGNLEQDVLIDKVKKETVQMRRRAFDATRDECQKFPIEYFFLDVDRPDVLAHLQERQAIKNAFSNP